MNYVVYYIFILLLLLLVGGDITKVLKPLKTPSFYPPGYLFGIIWPILFIIFGIFIYYAPKELQIISIIYFTLVLLWTPIFVYSESTAIGFYYLTFVLSLTAVLVYLSLCKYSYSYSWLLIPQVLWISFATILSYSLYSLN